MAVQKTAGQQYLVVDLDPFSIVKRLTTVEGPLAAFQLAAADMLLGASFLRADPTYWVSQEARLALKRDVTATEVLEWLWGAKAPSPEEQIPLIRHVGKVLGERFENYKAMHVSLPSFAKATVPESLVVQNKAVPKGAFSDGTEKEKKRLPLIDE